MEQDKNINPNISPDAIVIPTGGTVRGENGEYHSTTYEHSDAFGTLDGYARVEAAAIMARQYPDAMVVSTGKRLGDEVSPSHAAVVKRELIELGVKPERIVCDEKSTTTQNGVEQACVLAKDHGWQSIVFVTNEYHLARLRAMWEMIKPFVEANFCAAEDVISRLRPEFGQIFAQIKKTPAYKKRLESEARGIQALRAGTYQSAPLEDKKERVV